MPNPASSMSTPQSAKRRRLNDAASTLSKPFRTPLKPTNPRNAANPATPQESAAAADTTGVDSLLTPSSTGELAAASSDARAAHPSATPLRRPPPTTPLRPATSATPAGSAATRRRTLGTHDHSQSPDAAAAAAAQKTLIDLEARIRATRSDIDVLTQAANLGGAKQTQRLEELSAKWRAASQAAAEALFGGVKDKVDGMGGVRAWRLMERRKMSGWSAWDEDEGGGGGAKEDAEGRLAGRDGERESAVEALARRGEEREAERNASDAVDGGDAQGGEADQDVEDIFTMDMMLKSLNIELDVIGYDRQTQQWIT